MSERRSASSGVTRAIVRGSLVLIVAAVLLAAGCRGTVALSVNQPVGARVELVQKGKWFGSFGPEYGTNWKRVVLKTVQTGSPCIMELATNGRYRAYFDLSQMEVYDSTPTSMVEIRYEKEVVPPKYQEIIRLWDESRILDMICRLPIDVVADVLYTLGDIFKDRILADVEPAVLQQAATQLKAMLEAETEPSPKEMESWLKSFLKAEQLLELCKWVAADSVPVVERRYVPRGGRPEIRGSQSLFPAVVDSLVDALFSRDLEVKGRHVNIYREVILRGLLTKKVESKLVNPGLLRFYAEIVPYGATYYSDRALPPIDLLQDIGIAEVVQPTDEQEAELRRFGMTRAVKLEAEDRAMAIRKGLPPVSLKPTKVTAFRSQILGALLEDQMAYAVIWNNPVQQDTARYLTTFVTTNPYGMARVWTVRSGRVLWDAQAALRVPDRSEASLVEWVTSMLQHSGAQVALRPVAVVSFGLRPLAPWRSVSQKPVSFVTAAQELEPTPTEDAATPGGDQPAPQR